MPKYSDMLVYLRKREHLSQQELAEKLHLTRSAISMYETGKREPDLETFEVFADFYNVDMNTLTGGELKTPSSPQTVERDFAKNEHEEEMLLLARHIAPIPEKQRRKLLDSLKASADVYLDAMKLKSEDT